MTAPRAAGAPADRVARLAERVLRFAGDGRTGLLLLVLTGLANAVAAVLPDGPRLLDGIAYAILLGALALSGVAAVAVRAPAAWREWRRPSTVHPAVGAITQSLSGSDPEAIARALASVGYRVRLDQARGRWAVHGVRRGWSRFAGILSHLALVVLVLGAALGAAFGSETVFSLLPGEASLLDTPRPGFSSAVRLDAFDAQFGTDGRPRSLEAGVTFLRGGAAVRPTVLRVNEPGHFDGYLVHPWTYGPAVRLRVTTVGGTALLDASVPLDGTRDGVPVGSAELPSLGLTLGLALTDADANELGVSVVDGSGLVDSGRLRPGDPSRLGDIVVEVGSFDAWVTFMSRRDPGLALLLAGGILLCGSLAIAFWLPRRRLTIRSRANDALLVLRGERFDRPADELARVLKVLDQAR